MINFAMRSAAAMALVGGITAHQQELFGAGPGAHPGPKFVRIQADGTVEETSQISSRFVKARVQEMAKQPVQEPTTTQTAVAPETGQSEGDPASEGRFLTTPSGGSEAHLLKQLEALGMPASAAKLLVQTNPDLVRQLIAGGAQPAQPMGCSIRNGVRTCL